MRRSVADTNCDCNGNGDGRSKRHAYRDGDSYCHCHCHCYSNTNTNPDTKGYANAKTSADSAPARVVGNADLSAVAPPLRRGAKADSCD